MRHFVRFTAAVGIALLAANLAQAQTITPEEAANHIGSQLNVEGVVSQVSTTGSGTTFINFGGRYPDHIFYGVIFNSNADLFSDVERLEGRTVALNGRVDLYRGKPQIILETPEQIEIID